MRRSSCAVLVALAVSVLCAAPADAAGTRAARLPAEVTAAECVEGGGVIVVSADGEGTGSFTARCQGGTHDGEAVTRAARPVPGPGR
ncbi:hypothetical protein ABZ023_28400 [Streptomyces sp. NPDC006367]|uniref:hypothetical protein n=1 Tax=unclassified Streptomyces TaxID=2593676 RepID=UPI00339DFA50